MEICRLANMGRSSSRPAPPPAAPPAAFAPSNSSFLIHEDTEYGMPSLMAGVGHAGPSHLAAPPPLGLGVYEDTEMLGPMMQQGGGGGLMLHEDTEFMTRDIVEGRHAAMRR